MRFSLNWVKQYVDLDGLTIEQISDAVGQTLAEVEHVIDVGEEYRPIVVAKVLRIEKHPQADKLVITQIDAGPKIGLKQVVTGAPNVHEGDMVPYIPVGAKVPYNAYPDRFDGVIKAMKLRGIESEGMLCSERELCFGDNHDGIMILSKKDFPDAKITPGVSLAELANVNDYVIEIENKSLTHRGDVFSIIGVAREIAAALDRPFKASHWPKELPKHSTEKKYPLQVSIQATTTCHRFTAVVMDHIAIGPSPLWLRLLLMKYGVKSVNNVVDVTNYVMLEQGQPMHAFDYDQVVALGGEAELIIRKAAPAETMVGLDHKSHQLVDGVTLVTANKVPVAIGGVLGGEATAINSKTKAIILEAGNWDRFNIRRTSMSLGLFTDAASVFSRYQDPNKTMAGLVRAARLLQEMQAGQVAGPVVDEYPRPVKPIKMSFSIKKANAFIGEKITSARIVSMLNQLDLDPKVGDDGDTVALTIPTFRDDLAIAEDIYEEIVRLYGLNKVRETRPTRAVATAPANPLWEHKQLVRRTLVNQGLYETVNFNFISEQTYRDVGLDMDVCFKIINAISPEVQYMRSLLLPGLIAKTADNLRFYKQFGLFEMGRVHRTDLTYANLKVQSVLYTPPRQFDDPVELPVEDQHLAGVVTDRNANQAGSAYYLAKLHVDQLIAKLHIPLVEYNHYSEFSDKAIKQMPLWLQQARAIFHPARSAVVTANVASKNIYLGLIGELEPSTVQRLHLPAYTAAWELGLYTTMDSAVAQLMYREPSRFPAVEQDLCFIVEKNIPYEAVVKALQHGAAKARVDQAAWGEHLLREITPQDIFQPKGEAKTKQITVRVVWQSDLATLTDGAITALRQAMIAQVEHDVKGKLKTKNA